MSRLQKSLFVCVIVLAALLGTGIFLGTLKGWLSKSGEGEAPSVAVVSPVQPEDTQKAETLEEPETPEDAVETEEPEETGESEAESEEIRLLFAGDLFLTDLLQEKYQKQGIEAASSAALRKRLEEADVFMLNQEFPFGTTGVAMEDKQFTFRVDPSYISVLKELSVDIVTLANNHMLDFGREPLEETLDVLDSSGILHVGAGRDLEQASAWETLEVKGKTIGFLGASRVIPEASWAASSYQSGVFTTYDPTLLLERIKEAKEVCDFVVVCVHWGIERAEEPEAYQKSLGQQYIEAGADAVIGSHPHVLQGMEYYQGKPIYYSLGNFIFSNRDYETAMVELTLGQEECRAEWIPCVSISNQMNLKESD